MNKKPSKKNSTRPPTTIPGIHNVCVFCGSGSGKNAVFAAAARTLGQRLAEAGVGLVYGGGSLGLMGEIAKSVLKHNGYVTGIIPSFLSEKERMLRDVNELIVVDDMHQRKQLMFERSDAFVALPGGIGTLEELVEQLTWAQLGRHTKPIVIANIAGYWDSLCELLDHMRNESFIRAGLQVPYATVVNAEDILSAVVAAAPVASEERPDVIKHM
jgi:uncharacterized protein (TIGR00730 family)